MTNVLITERASDDTDLRPAMRYISAGMGPFKSPTIPLCWRTHARAAVRSRTVRTWPAIRNDASAIRISMALNENVIRRIDNGAAIVHSPAGLEPFIPAGPLPGALLADLVPQLRGFFEPLFADGLG